MRHTVNKFAIKHTNDMNALAKIASISKTDATYKAH